VPFTVRVELAGASEAEYARLHAAMDLRGFDRVVRAADGMVYLLPPAEYRFEGNSEINIITNSAKAAAASTGREFGVFVTESLQTMWYGLSRAR